jgi:hypothetical protein
LSAAAGGVARLLWPRVALGDAAIPVPRGVDPRADAEARRLWRELPKTRDACGEFDYFPEGGMRNFHCHLRTKISWAALQALAGVPVFLSGPHTQRHLELSSRTSFGHYNPEFVRWLGASFIPAASDPTFRAATQRVYDRYVRPLARASYVSHQKLHGNRAYLKSEASGLLRQLATGRSDASPYEKYFFFMNPKFLDHADQTSWLMDHGMDGGWDGNVVNTCVAFWIRRSIDGTDGEFFAALERLLATYDARFLASPQPA